MNMFLRDIYACLLAGLSHVARLCRKALALCAEQALDFQDRRLAGRSPLDLLRLRGARRQAALLVVDVQDAYCNPACGRGNGVTARIQCLAHDFRRACVPVYAVYFAHSRIRPGGPADFYRFRPDADKDTLVRKTQDSAFRNSDFHALLKKRGVKSLVVCGFNTSACIMSTVMDARALGYQVAVLEDGIGNDRENPADPGTEVRRMKDGGVVFLRVRKALRLFRRGSPA